MSHSRSVDGGIDEIPLPVMSGRLWLCGKHVVAPDPESALARVAATTIVCLTRKHEIEDRYPGYVDWLHAHAPGRAIWIPTPDLAIHPLDKMRPHLDDMVSRLHDGQRLIIHCAAGIGRSGTTAVALLMLLGENREDALKTVADHRPMGGPEVGAQRTFIEELELTLSQGSKFG